MWKTIEMREMDGHELRRLLSCCDRRSAYLADDLTCKMF